MWSPHSTEVGDMFARTAESPMSKRSRGNHAPAIKKEVALAAVRNESTRAALAKRLRERFKT